MLTQSSVDKKPIFVNTPTEINKISNYAHIGTQLASVMAYDPIDNHLIRNYAIFYSSFDESVSSQVKIDQETGRFLFWNFEIWKTIKLFSVLF